MQPVTQTPIEDRQMVALESDESLRLLASVGYGRLVYTHRALPAIRPVNHIIDDGEVVIRTNVIPAQPMPPAPGIRMPLEIVVAYQADEINPADHTGWSVVVTGIATAITDAVRQKRCNKLLHPWTHRPHATLIAIKSQLINGYRITA